jgi:hypothetical protein
VHRLSSLVSYVFTQTSMWNLDCSAVLFCQKVWRLLLRRANITTIPVRRISLLLFRHQPRCFLESCV